MLTALRPHMRGRRARAFESLRGQKTAEQRTPRHPEGLRLKPWLFGSSLHRLRVVGEQGGGQRPGHFMKAVRPREPGVGPQAGTPSPASPTGTDSQGKGSGGAGEPCTDDPRAPGRKEVRPQGCWPLTSKAWLEGRRPKPGPSGPASASGGGILFCPPPAAPPGVPSSLKTSAHQRPALLHRLWLPPSLYALA